MKRDLHLLVLSVVLSLALTACGGGGGGGGGDSGDGGRSGDSGEVGTSADDGEAVVMLSQDLAGTARAQPNPTMGALEAN